MKKIRVHQLVGNYLILVFRLIIVIHHLPAYRSIQTANKVLESQGRKSVPINIEPVLFECSAWYHGKPLVFMPPRILVRDRKFNIDPYYSPMYDRVDSYDDERKYYRRSRLPLHEIVRDHKDQGGTILLTAHGWSIEGITRGLPGLFHRHGRPEYLIQQILTVNYCNFAILERDARTGQWTAQLPSSHCHNPPAQLSRYNIIPVYDISTEYLMSTKRSQYLVTKGRSSETRHYSHHYR
ncbi:unnamed protein product [Rotaria magnacalcarata]|uniref:Phosphoglycerate mutase n=3 Tax=Rotaria magnacalcarata TaxID=392030 RepID=A0A816NLE6_9BILA|nr:unnamed protein product [Rotaria magnacalcarata]CAF1584631.1 unnamed protein product [Rotaria magnacalcarata]CAF2036031.1 unnamed protein product [Rotaria magnacalcarata]CAF5059435.1 unnamed protein product [Rotaria magnacalcarata]